MKKINGRIVSLSEYRNMRGLTGSGTQQRSAPTNATTYKMVGLWCCFVLGAFMTTVVGRLPEPYTTYAFYAAPW